MTTPGHKIQITATTAQTTPFDPEVAEGLGALVGEALRLLNCESATIDVAPAAATVVGIPVIGPHQLHVVDEANAIVTVTYPADADTVLSMQPDGRIETRPAGTCGPYERACQRGDRLVYNPTGPTGMTFIVPFTDAVPNN